MPTRSKRLCQQPGCPNLTTDRFCPAHAADEMLLAKQRERAEDRRRGTAAQRGYTARWARYAKAYLARPENKFCALHLDDGCAGVAQCVDHIVPPASPEDPLFGRGEPPAGMYPLQQRQGPQKNNWNLYIRRAEPGAGRGPGDIGAEMPPVCRSVQGPWGFGFVFFVFCLSKKLKIKRANAAPGGIKSLGGFCLKPGRHPCTGFFPSTRALVLKGGIPYAGRTA